MSFDTPTNRGRADKIVEIVGHLKRSAGANKPTPSEVAEILAPAIDALRDLGAIPTAPEGGAIEDVDAAIRSATVSGPHPVPRRIDPDMAQLTYCVSRARAAMRSMEEMSEILKKKHEKECAQ
ncbi:hypothetical protein [Roseobacter weihaiensis]|uniref:hypothetical protein n=1 Tax=Roseobacter weihaiensis TaxID=2763262 RepID=UPI001D0A1E67|nr:hypothetical protein [Roseobacter sp. H9]